MAALRRPNSRSFPAARNKVEVVRSTRCAGAPVVFHRVIDGDHGAPLQLNGGQLLLDFFRDKVREDAAVATSTPLEMPARPQPSPTSAAAAGSIKAVFEKYNLLGTFALDCGKPVGRDNRYYVHQLLDAEHVQRDMMSGPTARDFRVIFERAAELRPNEIVLGGTRDGQPVEFGLSRRTQSCARAGIDFCRPQGNLRRAFRERRRDAVDEQVHRPVDSLGAPLQFSSNHVINTTFYGTIDFAHEIAPIATFGRGYQVLNVNNSLPVKTVPELIAVAKADPGKLSIASPGIGRAGHVAGG